MKLDSIIYDQDTLASALAQQLQTESPAFSAMYPSSTATALVNGLSAYSSMLQYCLIAALANCYTDSAFSEAGVYQLAETLGNNLHGNSPAQVTVDITKTNFQTMRITIPANTQFEINKKKFFNEFPFIIPANSNVAKDIVLTQGERLEVNTTSSGIPYERFYFSSDFRASSTNVEVYVNGVQWLVVDSFLEYDKGYVLDVNDMNRVILRTDPEGRSYIKVGDGQLGTLPPAESAITIRFTVNDGENGNIQETNLEGTMVSLLRFIDSQGNEDYLQTTVVTTTTAYGGFSKQSIATLRHTSPYVFASGHRAIRRQDYRAILQNECGYLTSQVWGEYEEANMVGAYDSLMMNMVYYTGLKSFESYDYFNIGNLTSPNRFEGSLLSNKGFWGSYSVKIEDLKNSTSRFLMQDTDAKGIMFLNNEYLDSRDSILPEWIAYSADNGCTISLEEITNAGTNYKVNDILQIDIMSYINENGIRSGADAVKVNYLKENKTNIEINRRVDELDITINDAYLPNGEGSFKHFQNLGKHTLTKTDFDNIKHSASWDQNQKEALICGIINEDLTTFSGLVLVAYDCASSGSFNNSTDILVYDKTENRIGLKNEDDGTWNKNILLPFAKVEYDETTDFTIGEIVSFNAVGYFGNVLFALPGVVAVTPAGRNGTVMEKTEMDVDGVLIYSANQNKNSLYASINSVEIKAETDITYNSTLNLNYDAAGSIYNYCVFGKYDIVNGRIKNFESNENFASSTDLPIYLQVTSINSNTGGVLTAKVLTKYSANEYIYDLLSLSGVALKTFGYTTGEDCTVRLNIMPVPKWSEIMGDTKTLKHVIVSTNDKTGVNASATHKNDIKNVRSDLPDSSYYQSLWEPTLNNPIQIRLNYGPTNAREAQDGIDLGKRRISAIRFKAADPSIGPFIGTVAMFGYKGEATLSTSIDYSNIRNSEEWDCIIERTYLTNPYYNGTQWTDWIATNLFTGENDTQNKPVFRNDGYKYYVIEFYSCEDTVDSELKNLTIGKMKILYDEDSSFIYYNQNSRVDLNFPSIGSPGAVNPPRGDRSPSTIDGYLTDALINNTTGVGNNFPLYSYNVTVENANASNGYVNGNTLAYTYVNSYTKKEMVFLVKITNATNGDYTLTLDGSPILAGTEEINTAAPISLDNLPTYTLAQADIEIVNPGAGYRLNDKIQVEGTNSSTPIILQVTRVNTAGNIMTVAPVSTLIIGGTFEGTFECSNSEGSLAGYGATVKLTPTGNSSGTGATISISSGPNISAQASFYGNRIDSANINRLDQPIIDQYNHFTTYLEFKQPTIKHVNLVLKVSLSNKANINNTLIIQNIRTNLQKLFEITPDYIGKGLKVSDIYKAVMKTEFVEWCKVLLPMDNVETQKNELLIPADIQIIEDVSSFK